MNQVTLAWFESLFNVAYLITVWTLVALMIRNRERVPAAQRPVARLFTWAFGLLALGDTGHVGFRVLAYALGDLGTTFALGGVQISPVGVGMFTTYVTVTLFYVMMVVLWKKRFSKSYTAFTGLLFAAAVVRLGMGLLPANQWGAVNPPYPWSLYRNAPLLIQGLGVVYLILRDAFAANDRTFKQVGAMIIVSYAFYTPVILFYNIAPLVGMLMIPKTLAYVAVAWIAYTAYFRGAEVAPQQRASAATRA